MKMDMRQTETEAQTATKRKELIEQMMPDIYPDEENAQNSQEMG
jgi:hypothetical protein